MVLRGTRVHGRAKRVLRSTEIGRLHIRPFRYPLCRGVEDPGLVIFASIRAARSKGCVPVGRSEDGGVDHWPDLLERTDVLILDTETTGFADQSEVIDVAVLDTCGTVRFDRLSMPAGRIPTQATAVHGLTRADLRRQKAPAWPEVHDDLVRVLTAAKIVIAYNADFDSRLLPTDR